MLLQKTILCGETHRVRAERRLGIKALVEVARGHGMIAGPKRREAS